MDVDEFVSLCVDGGNDVVIVSVQETTEDDESGEFTMMLEIQLVPMKDFSRVAKERGFTKVMDRMKAAIEKGLVK